LGGRGGGVPLQRDVVAGGVPFCFQPSEGLLGTDRKNRRVANRAPLSPGTRTDAALPHARRARGGYRSDAEGGRALKGGCQWWSPRRFALETVVGTRASAAGALGRVEKVRERDEQVATERRRFEPVGAVVVEPQAETTQAEAGSGDDAEAVRTARARHGPVELATRTPNDIPIAREAIAAPGTSAGGGAHHVDRPVARRPGGTHPHILN
jgi:hypothetical protein